MVVNRVSSPYPEYGLVASGYGSVRPRGISARRAVFDGIVRQVRTNGRLSQDAVDIAWGNSSARSFEIDVTRLDYFAGGNLSSGHDATARPLPGGHLGRSRSL